MAFPLATNLKGILIVNNEVPLLGHMYLIERFYLGQKEGFPNRTGFSFLFGQGI